MFQIVYEDINGKRGALLQFDIRHMQGTNVPVDYTFKYQKMDIEAVQANADDTLGDAQFMLKKMLTYVLKNTDESSNPEAVKRAAEALMGGFR